MKSLFAGINSIFCAALALALLAGCYAPDDPKGAGKTKPGKEAAVLYFHIETSPDGTPFSQQVNVPRGTAEPINVEVKPFLESGSLLEATLVDTDKFGGFALLLQFNQHGVFALDSYTSANRGRRIAVFAQFGDQRWIAAPLINRRISNGMLQFTPDLTREEAEYVVAGLNNVAAKLKKRGAL